MIITLLSCALNAYSLSGSDSFRKIMTVTYSTVSVQLVVDKPAYDELDVLVVFHGTVLYDKNIVRLAVTHSIASRLFSTGKT